MKLVNEELMRIPCAGLFRHTELTPQKALIPWCNMNIHTHIYPILKEAMLLLRIESTRKLKQNVPRLCECMWNVYIASWHVQFSTIKNTLFIIIIIIRIVNFSQLLKSVLSPEGCFCLQCIACRCHIAFENDIVKGNIVWWPRLRTTLMIF